MSGFESLTMAVVGWECSSVVGCLPNLACVGTWVQSLILPKKKKEGKKKTQNLETSIVQNYIWVPHELVIGQGMNIYL